MLPKLRALAEIIRHPVAPETKQGLKRAWERLPEKYRTSRQMYGRHGEGCGATIGMMPRCDFSCTGCYLGEDANKIPYEPVGAIKAQMRVLRERLGKWGNLQLTDGEVALRPEEELIEIIQYCREIELLPMLMSHGDPFRRRPGLLERLTLAGLPEVSIHVDTTQRGRKGQDYKYAETEASLNPLRAEFAQMIRDVRAKTGIHLRAATTMTVHLGNLPEVPDVMRWLRDDADAFDLVSFQPMAQVGRTEDGLGGGVTAELLWEKVAEGLYDDDAEAGFDRLKQGQMWLGHPSCNRYVPGVMVAKNGTRPEFHPVGQFGDPVDEEMASLFYGSYGGVAFRVDGKAEAAARLFGMWLRHPLASLWTTAKFLGNTLRRWAPGERGRLALDLARKRARTSGLMIVSHHFMSAEQIRSEEGQERLGLCVFHVPINGEIRSMCEVNALGIRDAYYDDIAAGRVPGSSVPKQNPLLPIIGDRKTAA